MTSGGARSNSGRRPDPQALRRDRSGDAETWTTLLEGGFAGPTPEWPLRRRSQIEDGPDAELSDVREAVVWDRMWRKPQAAQWDALGLHDEVALYVRYLVEAEVPDASASVRTLVKQHQELLGLSTAGLLRLRWKIAAASAAADAAPVRVASSSRARLKAVPNVGIG
jgi:hypothetical protein